MKPIWKHVQTQNEANFLVFSLLSSCSQDRCVVYSMCVSNAYLVVGLELLRSFTPECNAPPCTACCIGQPIKNEWALIHVKLRLSTLYVQHTTTHIVTLIQVLSGRRVPLWVLQHTKMCTSLAFCNIHIYCKAFSVDET